jgi:hypothetical protein
MVRHIRLVAREAPYQHRLLSRAHKLLPPKVSHVGLSFSPSSTKNGKPASSGNACAFEYDSMSDVLLMNSKREMRPEL